MLPSIIMIIGYFLTYHVTSLIDSACHFAAFALSHNCQHAYKAQDVELP